MRKYLLLIWLLCFCGIAFAQQTVKGRITAQEDGSAIIGATVSVKGNATLATGTDANGNYQLNLPTGQETLVVTYIGYVTQEVAVNGRSQVDLVLRTDAKALEEVVVVGYGVQQKKLVTGATVQVKGEDLQKQSTTDPLQALQGQAPGVQITSTSGQPGEGMRVVIRGLGTVGNAGPLYVVDGVLTGDISYLNPADIQSIDVLKDAASAAIYGSQAANGVVLVTTRQGKSGQPAQITFDTYFGVQNVGRKVDLLNAREYAILRNEALVNSGETLRFTNEEVAALGEGTDWLDRLLVKDALTQNYSLGAQGGSETSTFSTALSYTNQEGIVGGKDFSNYERYNFRINTEHSFYQNKVKLGQHLTFAYTNNQGIRVGNQYDNTLRNAFNTSPLLGVEVIDNSASTWYNGEANPYYQMVFNNQNKRNHQRLLGDVYLQVEPIKNLKVRTSLGMDYYANESRGYTPLYTLSIYSFNDSVTYVNQSMGKGRSLIWDNLVTYNFKAAEDHNVEVMVGSSAFQRDGSSFYGSNANLVIGDLEHAWLANATNKTGAPYMSVTGEPSPADRRMSYFGRFNYNFKETYLLNATFRADGSSRFFESNRWGYFPSVSVGWVVSNESFMENTLPWMDYFKLRASWGQVGNQNINFFQYLAPVTFENTNYIFGPEEGGKALVSGAYPSRLGNPDLIWETSEQTNLGFDANLMNGKMAVTFDWYKKTTKDWLLEAPILATAGARPPFINGGNVKNSGVELGITFNDNIGAFNYSVGVNGAYNKNRVGKIPTADGIIHGDKNVLFDNSLEFYRAQNGYPIGYFWGLKTNGIFQTEAEVAAYRNAQEKVIQPNAQPGDVRYVDVNGDGTIDNLDRANIGNPNPDVTFGVTLSANYKGFDFSMLASGVAGNQIVQSYRNQANQYANYTSAMLDRWHGPGSSTTMPRVTTDNRNWTNFSDLYLHDGDFLRISNVTLGYDLGRLVPKSFINQVRIYASVQNLYTFTTYEGMDPEIGYSNGFASGIDLGYYPRPRTMLVGANIKF
ncbi:SusC/RagA family TonB-linked outer membrane protein [Rufibacter glacialis]|uniref:SusC/RagA family TonB-linked outer membrane protein n=1 Tax=Rufibacter glacialis TaxID=1259555 RepID=A0A5M8QLS9_9BACT|nr:TonB-dependent receptor [Rufibacter glacialis]KAA6435603.1 TonB-dependent receptor [Rufibacter glacialis]GGK64896.1 SusC/RagA family TonB-linked outer membrane protein [Rufibacter glacialis]